VGDVKKIFRGIKETREDERPWGQARINLSKVGGVYGKHVRGGAAGAFGQS